VSIPVDYHRSAQLEDPEGAVSEYLTVPEALAVLHAEPSRWKRLRLPEYTVAERVIDAADIRRLVHRYPAV
jgi:hypothetical protein